MWCCYSFLFFLIPGWAIFAVRYGKRPYVSKTKKALVWAVLVILLFIAAGILFQWIVVGVLLHFIPRY